MRSFHLLLLFALLTLATPAFPQQDIPRAEVYGGYSFASIDTNFDIPRQKANGWEASVSGNLNKWFAVEGSVSAYYKSYAVDLTSEGLGVASVKVADYSYVVGPRLNIRPVFIHARFGGDHLSGSGFGVSASQDSVAGAVGGGVQLKVAPRISVRGSADYVFTRHDLFGVQSFTQNNYRIGAGIVYSFGGRESKSQPAPPREKGMLIALLGMRVAATEENRGAEIVELAPNGAAELAGIKVGDVIDLLDNTPVRTPMELATALSGHTAGSQVQLGVLVQGAWQTHKTLILGGSQ